MEAFAVAASVVSVASLFIQVAEKVQALLDFWISFQDAPAIVKRIAEDLNNFHDILKKGFYTHCTDNSTLRKLLERSEDKIEKLGNLVQKFEPKFRSTRFIVRKWASFKATLNKGNLEEFQRSLGDTKLDLILIGQIIAEQTVQYDHQSLATSILCLESQHSRLVSTVESLGSLESDVRNHFCDLQRKVQEILQQILPLASGSMSGVMKEMLSTAIETAVQSPEMRGIMKDLVEQGKTSQQNPQSTHDSRSYKLDVKSSQTNYEKILEHPHPSGSIRAVPIAINGCQRTSRRRKEVIKCAVGKYTTFLGTIKWRTRTVRLSHRASKGDDIERFEVETDITLQPSRWLSARCISLQLSMGTIGLTCSIRQYSMVPRESLVFKYCQTANLHGVRDLLQHGHASPRDTTPDGRTPIHFAAGSSDFSICELLIEAGANVNAEDDYGQTPIHYASRFGSRKPEESVLATFRALVEHGGADTSAVNAQGANILAEVGWSSQECIGIAWLLQRDEVDIDVKELNFGRTAIMTLVCGSLGDEGSELLKVLINRGVDIQAQKDNDADDDESGYTALHFAIRNICEEPSQNHNTSLLGLLLEQGADAHVLDGKGKTPTAIALSTSYAFNAWRQALHGHQNLESFVREELRQSPHLYNEGWREDSLLELFECNFVPVLPATAAIPTRFGCDYHKTFWETNVWEPWWLELQNLIKIGMKPIPPLPPMWRRRIISGEETPEYLNIETGILTQNKPEGAFFSNLETSEAQILYREGSIKIEREKPFSLVNRGREEIIDYNNVKGCVQYLRDQAGAVKGDKSNSNEDTWEYMERDKQRLDDIESDGEDVFEDLLDDEVF